MSDKHTMSAPSVHAQDAAHSMSKLLSAAYCALITCFVAHRQNRFQRRLEEALFRALEEQLQAQDGFDLATARGTGVQAARLRLVQATGTVLGIREAKAEREAALAGLNLTFLQHLDSITEDDNNNNNAPTGHGIRDNRSIIEQLIIIDNNPHHYRAVRNSVHHGVYHVNRGFIALVVLTGLLILLALDPMR